MRIHEVGCMKGKQISIRKFEIKDIKNKVRWINDDANNQYLHYDLPLEEEKTRRWFLKNKDKKDRYDAVIEYEGIPIGIIGLLKIDNRQAEYYVTIGEKEYKGMGIAKSATFLLLDYAFSGLGLHTVYLFTEIENVSAQKLFEHCGFIKVGIAEEPAINRGKLVDRFIYQISVLDYFMLSQADQILCNTPLYEIENNTNRIFIKRDDLLPISFGGNKARKAVNFFREIDKFGFDCIVTYGSSSSNHCRIISNMAAGRNIPCYIVGPKEASKSTFNSKMMKLFGAEVIMVSIDKVHDTIENMLFDLKQEGKNPYFIPGGGHGNLGTQAYVDCYYEILEFENKNNIYFDYIFFASGTGTTQAGLVCGQIIHKDKRNIVGISIARKNPRGRRIVIDSISEYLREKGYMYDNELIENNTHFIDCYVDEGYGKTNHNIQDTIKYMLVRHGISMDSTYTAKAYTGMKEYLSANNISKKNILFIHTGGTPLFFDDINTDF